MTTEVVTAGAVDLVQVVDGTLVKMMAWAAPQLAVSTDRACR